DSEPPLSTLSKGNVPTLHGGDSSGQKAHTEFAGLVFEGTGWILEVDLVPYQVRICPKSLIGLGGPDRSVAAAGVREWRQASPAGELISFPDPRHLGQGHRNSTQSTRLYGPLSPKTPVRSRDDAAP